MTLVGAGRGRNGKSVIIRSCPRLKLMIKFVYFDLGGVVIKDFNGTDKWQKMKRVMGVKEKFDTAFDTLFDEYEREELCLTRDVDTIIPVFSKKFELKLPENFSILNYLVGHFERNNSIWPVIKEVAKTCGIGLLTNMYPGMFGAIKNRGLLPPIEWDEIIDSSVVHLQKPDSEIFQLAEKKAEVQGEEIFYVDDVQRNIDAALQLGWQTFFYDSTDHEKSSRALLTATHSLVRG
jgi:epoxide hydrolase-like predicted phosphatase